MIPSIGFWAIGDAVMRRVPRLTQPVLSGLAIVWIAIAGVIAIYDYFVVWGQSAEVRDAYQHTLVAEVDYLQESPPSASVILSSVYPNVAHDPSIYLVLQDGANWDSRWVDARYALLAPDQGDTTVVVPASTPLHPGIYRVIAGSRQGRFA